MICFISGSATQGRRNKFTGFTPKITRIDGPGGVAIVGYNPPKR